MPNPFSPVEPANKVLLSVAQLSCERDDRVLIDQLDFHLRAGEVVQLEGPNGSGKTTLLRVLCGLSDDYQGQIFWCGQPRRKVEAEFRQNTLYFGHATAIKGSLSARENLSWVLSLKLGAIRARELSPRIDSALDRVGLYSYEDVPVYSLSAGQKRRVALARLLLEPAALWVLDEPFTAIDRLGVEALESVIQHHAETGGAVLITSHHALAFAGIRKLQLGLGGGRWQCPQ